MAGRPPELVERLLAIAAAGIAAVEGETAVAAALARPELATHLRTARRVFGVAVGKAAPEMHAGLISRVAPASWGGGIVVSHRRNAEVPAARHIRGDHPRPGQASETAGRALLDFLAASRLTEEDLVVFSVSGGASALMAVPSSGLEPGDLGAIGDSLLRSGIGIAETNAVRRMLSPTHNGGLARAAQPARCIGLIVNDVAGAPLQDVGSGPTYPRVDASAEATRLVSAHVPEPVRGRALAVIRRRLPSVAAEVRNVEVAGPGPAKVACRAAAEAIGMVCEIWPEPVTVDAALLAERLAATLREWRRLGRSDACLVASGEVSVRVTGSGQGGRCQQLAWEMVPRLAGLPGAAFVGVATDGRDHVAGVGGAWASEGSDRAVTAAGVSWHQVAAANDAHRGLEAIGQLLPERSTGTNVTDLYLVGLE